MNQLRKFNLIFPEGAASFPALRGSGGKKF
jgi:hypothetical protein